MITIFTIFVFLGIAGIWFFTKKKPDKQKRLISIIVSIVAFLGFGLFTELNKKNETVKENPSKEMSNTIKKDHALEQNKTTTLTKSDPQEKNKEENNNSQKFYEINKIRDEYGAGSQVIDFDTYNDFVEGALTLEGVISKFGLPTNAIGAEEGDAQMEVIYPSNENNYSVGLIFENKKTNFGNWILKEKYVVETSGVHIPKYEE
ncbi:hypothetical protein [Vagococcus lutrae]|uniref:hypothetical protein n=1 Tax=Vagococcus lutrae TaxID=81947 RepID=UPI00288F5F33|nr:hypothetical protein [Vagococcus lutrae]MDT2805273.1 hypothetical protein [Vagococcus lutrae]